MRSDFLIIGAGIMGYAVAFELVRQGATVTLVERGRAGCGASWAGGGILSPLLPWDYAPAVTRLTDYSVGLYEAWTAKLAAETGIDAEFRRCGLWVLPPYDHPAAMNWCSQHATRIERSATPQNLVPQIAAEGETLWLPDTAQVRNPRLLRALRRWLEIRGVGIVENAEATSFCLEGDEVTGVETARGRFAAGAYIVCAGAWSGKLLGPLAAGLEVTPIRGQMLLLRIDPRPIEAIVLQGGRYIIPRNDGHVLVGSTLENAGFDASIDLAAGRELLNWALGVLPLLKGAERVRQWAGLRPGYPNNVPLIDKHPRIANLYVNTGHFRYGVTMAPGSARLLVDPLFGKSPAIDVNAYRWPAGASR
ncbi:MAG: glycine oxidase ThiO [Burkholderiales bacterium]